MVTCTKCGQDKPRGAFSPNPNKHNGLQSHCKTCCSEAMRERRRTQPEFKARERRRNARYDKERRMELAWYRKNFPVEGAPWLQQQTW